MEHDHTMLAPGTRFGRYRIESLLGAGAMGAVYLATHIGLDKRAVVKVLHPEHARSSSIRMRFFREGRAAAATRHPHVVDVTDVGEHEGVGHLVMEHVDGETLGSLLEHQGALPLDRAVDLLLPIIAAVDAAHAAGVIHRDLKPENLFVARAATGEPLPRCSTSASRASSTTSVAAPGPRPSSAPPRTWTLSRSRAHVTPTRRATSTRSG